MTMVCSLHNLFWILISSHCFNHGCQCLFTCSSEHTIFSNFSCTHFIAGRKKGCDSLQDEPKCLFLMSNKAIPDFFFARLSTIICHLLSVKNQKLYHWLRFQILFKFCICTIFSTVVIMNLCWTQKPDFVYDPLLNDWDPSVLTSTLNFDHHSFCLSSVRPPVSFST